MYGKGQLFIVLGRGFLFLREPWEIRVLLTGSQSCRWRAEGYLPGESLPAPDFVQLRSGSVPARGAPFNGYSGSGHAGKNALVYNLSSAMHRI